MLRHRYYTQRNGGRWRVARVPHRCDWATGGIRCLHQILAGERYFDTNQHNPRSSNSHATYRICENCANERVT